MKLIKRLNHDTKELTDALFGWDVFWSGDYSLVDKTTSESTDISTLVIPKGYTIILAMNIGKLKFLKRFFIKVKDQ